MAVERRDSLREWQHGDNAPASAGRATEPVAGEGLLCWWRVAYHPVGNQLSVALMDGPGPRAKVLVMESTALILAPDAPQTADEKIHDLKVELLRRYRESQRLIAAHSGPCESPLPSPN